jgi:uncharacterized repeat protein (TIGR03803 family)
MDRLGIRPQFISPSTKSVAILIDGNGLVVANVNPAGYILVAFRAPAGKHTFTVTAYDGIGGRGNQLSTGATPPIIVPPSGSVHVALTLGGIAARIVLSLDAQVTVGYPATVNLSVTAEDADENIMLGDTPFAHPVRLTSSDPVNGRLSQRTLGKAVKVGVMYSGANVSQITFSASGAGVRLVAPTALIPAHAREVYRYSFEGAPDGAWPLNGALVEDRAGSLYGTTLTGGSGVATDWGIGFGSVFKLTRTSTGYSESILHGFQSGSQWLDGSYPSAGLIADRNGNLYGTTEYGGGPLPVDEFGPLGAGTVFRLIPTANGYRENILDRFQFGFPVAALIADKMGALYGTTPQGGSSSPGCVQGNTPSSFASGCGIVFKLTPTATGYQEAVLYTFQGGGDGVGPAALIADNTGAFYGSTNYGGINNTYCTYPTRPGGPLFSGCGTVFKLTPTAKGYQKRILYRFQGGSDGYSPNVALVNEKTGALYGTTFSGGLGGGTVFMLTPTRFGFTKSILYSFAGGWDGEVPGAGLAADSRGSLYGTTDATVFKLVPTSFGTYSEIILHRFNDAGDGAGPSSGLLLDAAGSVYGTTSGGGAFGNGTVFKLQQSNR